MTAYSHTPIRFDQQRIDQLAVMLKAIGQPLRIQLLTILIQKRLVSIPTIQEHLPGVDQFLIYSNLRYMEKKSLLKKLRKGREIYYGLSEEAISAGFETFFQDQLHQQLTRPDHNAGPAAQRSARRETPVLV